jgi:hypothetical protein
MTKRTRSTRTHGGRRKGAGRKGFLGEAAKLSTSFPRAEFDALEAIARERHTSIGSLVREAVRQFLEREGKR